MLSVAENERITHVGKGTPGGEYLRRYWWPACLSKELPENDGAPVRVRMLGEDLIAFRDTEGNIGLVEAYCPHRRAPLFFARNEECGLRCVYHGWKFDKNGDCVDMPSEPAGTTLQAKVKILAYPCIEKGGVIWTYMGDKDNQPEAPDYEWTRAPETHRYVSKTSRIAIGCRRWKAVSTPRIRLSRITTSLVSAIIYASTTKHRFSKSSARIMVIITPLHARWMPGNICVSTTL